MVRGCFIEQTAPGHSQAPKPGGKVGIFYIVVRWDEGTVVVKVRLMLALQVQGRWIIRTTTALRRADIKAGDDGENKGDDD